MIKKAKGTVFVEHIKEHLNGKGFVMCKFCGKGVEEIYDDWKREGSSPSESCDYECPECTVSNPAKCAMWSDEAGSSKTESKR